MTKPRLGFWQIWNMCIGFFGIQIAFGLQNANTSRIFQTLGAEVDSLAILWIAAPLTGLIVQPIIGHMSDRTWGPLGRRRPYFLVGAVLTTIALIFMPNSPILWMAAATLWIMDASINITMEPFRAFVGDKLPDEQRAAGYAMQSFFIGAGAVFASCLPWLLSNVFHVASTAPEGIVPDSVRISFYVGAFAMLTAVLWTIFTSPEYSPEQVAAFENEGVKPDHTDASLQRPAATWLSGALVWIIVGALMFAGVWFVREQAAALAADVEDWRKAVGKELYILAGFIAGFGVLQAVVGLIRRAGGSNGLTEVLGDMFAMPRTMRELAVVQFFSWFGLFAMWIYTTAAVTAVHYGTSDTTSAAYNQGADWVGVLFGVYNGVAALAAFTLPVLARRTGRPAAHAIALTLGGIGLIGVFLIRDPQLLWLPMIGVGVAWASIVSLPYAMLAGAVPERKMGVFMGVFNIFIVVPQLVAATLLGLILNALFGGQAIWALIVGGCSLLIAALMSLRVREAVR